MVSSWQMADLLNVPHGCWCALSGTYKQDLFVCFCFFNVQLARKRFLIFIGNSVPIPMHLYNSVCLQLVGIMCSKA